jgi:hypothetical protein
MVDKEASDMKSLWEERTAMLFDLIDLIIINKGTETEDLIKDLKENSEDIAKATCGALKAASEIKRKDHEEYYYQLIEKNHPIRGVKLSPDEDMWLRNYTSVSMLKRILNDNISLVVEYFKCTKDNDIYGQKAADERLLSNVTSISGFLKSLSSSWDFELLNSTLTKYFRNLKKQSDVMVGAKDPELFEKEKIISDEISQIFCELLPPKGRGASCCIDTTLSSLTGVNFRGSHDIH